MAEASPDLGAVSLESLAAQAQAGDRTSLEALAQQVREPLRAFLATRVPHDVDADDLAQETLLRAFRHLDRYDPTRPFVTWLFTIGKRLAINHVVAEKRRNALGPGPSTDTATLPVDDDDSEVWHRAKAMLSDEAYRALWLRYARDASIKEVAADLGRSQVSTKVLLYRSRKRLLSELRS
jgi:RNA polymerase sigma-70 factor (ECF subfamily)